MPSVRYSVGACRLLGAQGTPDRRPRGGQSPQPSRLPNGKSKLGQRNTTRWQHQAIGNWPDRWLHRLSGSALSRATSLQRNERDRTGTFPRANSNPCSCCGDRQLCCSGRVPWEPSGGVPFIWCPSFDFPFCRSSFSDLVNKSHCRELGKRSFVLQRYSPLEGQTLTSTAVVA